jgi:hypothetical protein
MVEIILAVIVLALLVYGLERNHARQPKPRPRLYGSSDVDDRKSYRSPPVFSP